MANPPNDVRVASGATASLRVALEQFVSDNADLERLESILDDFNPFVALRWTKQEIRHSAFLRWLLDPTETHGLGGYFLRLFLKRIARQPNTGNVSVVDVDSWSLSDAAVLQEWKGIDVLVQDEPDGFVLVIENKTDSSEHSDQLRRYRREVERHFPKPAKLFAYLTPGAERPSDDAYVPISYGEIVALLENTLQRQGEQLADKVRTFLGQYVEMVRRYIVEDSEIQKLCQTIYQKHRKALDAIFEHRPDRTLEITAILMDVLTSHSELVADHCTKACVRFIPKSLDFLPHLGEGWTPTKRLLLFEIQNYGGEVCCALILGPGESCCGSASTTQSVSTQRSLTARRSRSTQNFGPVTARSGSARNNMRNRTSTV